MAGKTSGLGDNLYLTGVDISNDVGSLSKISAAVATLDVTGINKSAVERILGLRDGAMSFSSFFNKTGAHAKLATLPTADIMLTYCRGTTLGNPAASLNGRQLNYDGKRDNKGALNLDTTSDGDGFGLEWGYQLTPGTRTDTSATNGSTLLSPYSAAPNISGDNSTFEVSIGSWIAGANCTVARSTAQSHGGTGSLAITCTGTSQAYAYIDVPGWFDAATGFTYTASGWARAATTGRAVEMGINWFDSAGVYISTTSTATGTDSTSAWTQMSGSGVAPAGARYGSPLAYVDSPGGAGEVHYYDDILVTRTTYGAQAYAHFFEMASTSCVVKVQHSVDGSTWADLITFAGVATAGANTAQRVATSNATQVNPYLRAISTGTFSSAKFAVMVSVNQTSGVVF